MQSHLPLLQRVPGVTFASRREVGRQIDCHRGCRAVDASSRSLQRERVNAAAAAYRAVLLLLQLVKLQRGLLDVDMSIFIVVVRIAAVSVPQQRR
jgi:hypothetical protein